MPAMQAALTVNKATFSPPRFCAPMAGITHSAFRRLVSNFGGYGALFTELLAGNQILRDLEAVLVTVSEEGILMISGSGDVLEPDEGVVGIGTGGPYALAAARAFQSVGNVSIVEIARRSLEIAGAIDIYTNQDISLEEVSW
jgi:tRNA-dihydrouridine synthase